MKLGLLLIIITTNSVATTLVVSPIYPKEARNKCIEGYVNLSYEIDESRNAINIKVLDSTPEDVFEKVSIRYLRENIKSIINNNKEPYEQKIEFKLEECELKIGNK